MERISLSWRRIAGCLLLFAAAAEAQDNRRILAVTASSGDYIVAAGGTLAARVRDGWRVTVVQFGNDEKYSSGSTPAHTRLANINEGKARTKLLGITDLVHMDHKSGELGYLSSTEMRNQLFALIRHVKPRVLFIPDPYVHYQDDQDIYWVGKMAEEAWGYSNGAMFGNELERAGLAPHGAPIVYYYAPARPYRKGEGGAGLARFVAEDIAETLEHKLGALDLLRNRGRTMASQAAARMGMQTILDDLWVTRFVREYAVELAETIGAKHGFRYGEEFNHVDVPGAASSR
jgi:LmbE family N-acetylglucosaminyl deacetylase